MVVWLYINMYVCMYVWLYINMYVWLQRRQDNLYIQVFATLRQDSSTPKPRQDTSMKPRQDTFKKPRQDTSIKKEVLRLLPHWLLFLHFSIGFFHLFFSIFYNFFYSLLLFPNFFHNIVKQHSFNSFL